MTLVIVNAASNTLNQVYDYDIDKINKPYRPLPQKLITKDEALTITWVLYLVTIWRISMLHSRAAFPMGISGASRSHVRWRQNRNCSCLMNRRPG